MPNGFIFWVFDMTDPGIESYTHLFYPSTKKRQFEYETIRSGKCNKKYAKLIYKSKVCPADMVSRNAYFSVKNVPHSCSLNKLYREPSSVCTTKPFPRLTSFAPGTVEVLRFGQRLDPKQSPTSPQFTFYYAAPKTTGLYLDLKNPLVAANKMDALLRLGWDFKKRIRSVGEVVHPGDQYLIAKILGKAQDVKSFDNEVGRLVDLFRAGVHYSVIFGTGHFDFYDMDLIHHARVSGFDSIVLLNEPYNQTSAATEIIHLFPPYASLNMLSKIQITATNSSFV
jgi:hypothetical protein